jgi:NTE family protein
MFPSGRIVLVLIALAALAGCASAPLVYPEVDPPQAEPLAPFAATSEPGPVLALVLSGGASRGFAHVGVIKELERAGYSARVVVGTSAGSFVGALYAGGYSGDALQNIAAGMNEGDLRDVIFPDRGFLRGERLQDYLNRYLDDRPIEVLPRRFAAVATDLLTGNAIAFNSGNTGMAVRASSSIPGIFQPVRIRGRDYVDGGLVSPVPVRIARQMGADVVVAVDASRRPEDATGFDTTVEIIEQAIAIVSRYVGQDERAEADVLITPAESEIGYLDFDKRQLAIEAGERAARAALPAIRAAMERAAARLAE